MQFDETAVPCTLRKAPPLTDTRLVSFADRHVTDGIELRM